MSDTDDDNEISFRVKFVGRIEVVRPDGVQILEEAAESLKHPEPSGDLRQIYAVFPQSKTKQGAAAHGFLWNKLLENLNSAATKPDEFSTEKVAKKSKVHLFLSLSGVDILENKTKFLLYSCPLSTISFCAVLPSSSKVFGFVAKHPASDMYHCYLFQSKKFSHVLVSVIGDAFRASEKEESVAGRRDLIVEALRHKNKMLQKENDELKKKLSEQTSF